MKQTLSSLKKQAVAWFSRYFRLKNSNDQGFCECYTCGKVMFWKDAQAGHLLDGRYNSILFNEDCQRIQCTGCNLFKAGNKEVFIPKYIDEMGREKFDEMVRLKGTTVKFGKRELEVMKDTFKDQARRIADKKGLDI